MIRKLNNLIKNKKSLIFLDQILVSGSNFLLGILLARFLGLDLFGQFSLIWLFVLFFSSIQVAFIISPMLTHGGKETQQLINHYLTNIFYFQIFFSIICIILLSLFLILFQNFSTANLKEYFYYIILLIISFLSQDFMRRYLMIKKSYFKLLSIDLISYIGQLGVVSYLVYTDSLTLKKTILSISIVFLLSYIFSLFFLEIKKTRKQYSILLFLRNWYFSKWLVYSSLLQWGSGNLFIIVASYLLGPWAVGVIRVMQNTMGIFNVIFIALENILPIKFAEIYKKTNYSNLLNYSKKFRLLIFISFFLFATLLYLFSKELIYFLYGNSYVEYSYLLIYFLSNTFVLYFLLINKILVRTLERNIIIFKTFIINIIFTLIIIYPLIKYLNITGVAIGIVLSNIVQFFTLKVSLNKRFFNV